MANFRFTAMRFLATRYPLLRAHHDDLVGETLLDLTKLIQAGGDGSPDSWYEQAPPPPRDEDRFTKLAFTVLKRRVVDYFRSSAIRFSEDIDSLPESQHPVSPEIDAGRLIDLKRTTGALLAALDGLSSEDRELVQTVALGGNDLPMSDRDRQRLSRLRRELLSQLHRRLGPSALECIQRY